MKFFLIIALLSFILTLEYAAPKVEAQETKPKKCRPGEIIKFECNQCTCTSTGVMQCTESRCPKSKPIEQRKRELATNCRIGEVLDLDCNRCLCIRRGKVECTEKKCGFGKYETPTHKFYLAEQNRRLNKIGKTCDVGDVIETNCKSCTCRSPGNLKCTKAKRNCKTKPGLTINMKKHNEKQQSLVSSLCSHKDKISVDCNRCTCIPGASMVCTAMGCEGINHIPKTPSAEEDGKYKPEIISNDQNEDQNQERHKDQEDEDVDPGINQDSYLASDEVQGLDENQGPDKERDHNLDENRPQKPEENYPNPDIPKDGGKYAKKHLEILKSIKDIKQVGKHCKPKEVIETICHLCKCVMAGVVNCKLKKPYEEFQIHFSAAMSRKPDKKGFVETLKRQARKQKSIMEDEIMRSQAYIQYYDYDT